MKELYYDTKHPASLGGVARLHREMECETGGKIKRRAVRDFLEGEDTYTLHKPARVNFPRNKVFAPAPLSQFQADLCDMNSLAEFNDQYKYLLTIIDVFSKKAYVRVLKNKSAAEVVKAFKSVLLESGIPKKIQTDAGKEFFNKSFHKLMSKHKITHFATASDLKASVIERFNRTLKTRMWRYFTAKNTRRYIGVVQDLVASYNNTFHSSIRMTPNEVCAETAMQVFRNLYDGFTCPTNRSPKKFKVGDNVRLSKLRGVFDKKYEQSYTDEIFTVKECIRRKYPVYKLVDYDGEPIEGTFYEYELQKVRLTKDYMYKVEKILKKRTVGGEKQLLIRFKGYPSKFDTWLPETQVVDI